MVKATAIERFKRNFVHPLAIALQNSSTRKLMAVVAAATVILLALSAYLDFRSSRNLREVAKTQFNEEQMVIARYVKWQIEREMSFIRKEIDTVSGMIAEGKDHLPETLQVLEHMLYRVLGNSVYKIDIIDSSEQKVYSYGYLRQWRVNDLSAGAWGDLPERLEDRRIYVSSPVHEIGGMHMFMARLVDGTSDILVLTLDASRFLGQFLRDIRSGRSGYAWVIDGNGTFLYHPYTDFIGKSAFAAREERDPGLSHQSIDFIQKKRMLKGQEGTGSYTAGWHRGFTGKIEKLIAYCPIEVSAHPSGKWSVAVVAPMSEIEGYINQTYLWRFLLQALIIVAVIFSGTAVLFNEIRWARELERKVAERTEALQKSEEKYRSLVESAEDFIFTIDREGRFQSMNSFTANFFGGRPEDFIGRNIDHIFAGESSRKHRKMLELVYRHERSVRDEFTLQAGDHELWISANFMPIRDESGRVESVLCIARDVTNEKTMERQLINTEKLASLGTLAAGVAHEINNPLGVILGFVDLLVRKTPSDSQAYDDLKTIERQGMHCKQIVENLLCFARFGEGAESRADVNEGIRNVVNIVSHTLEMACIDLITELDEDIPYVRGDPRELQQVFLNLINNACAAMKGGGRLTIRSRYDHEDKKAIAEVEDTGHGISRENLDRIFEPFFTTKPEGEGTGLGLSVTYGIVSKYGGTIDCHSTPRDSQETAGDGRGTVFIVKLPIFEGEY